MCSIETQYSQLLESGELKEMFPTFSGEWNKDKKLFTKYYEDNQKIEKDNYLEIESDEDDYVDDSEYYQSI